jgi:hypothetical protein
MPKKGIHPGLLYLLCASDIVQKQVKALASGSVIDAICEEDVGSVWVNYPKGDASEKIGDDVVAAWGEFAEATRIENDAAQEFDEIMKAAKKA